MPVRHLPGRALAIALALAPLAASAASLGAPSAYQLDPAHDGQITMRAPFAPPLKQAWSITFGGPVSYPVVDGSTAFVSVSASSGGGEFIYALDIATGQTKWAKLEGDSFASTGYLAYDNGALFFTNTSGPLEAFNAETGKQLWSSSLPYEYYFNFFPIALNGYVYAGGDESGTIVYQVSEKTGAVGWSAELEGGGAGVTASPGAVYFSVPFDVAAWDQQTGALLWNYAQGGDGGGGGVAAYYRGRVYAPLENLTAGVVLDAVTGKLVGSTGAYLPAFYRNVSFTAAGSQLSATDLNTGNLAWLYTLPNGTFVLPPVIVNGTVFALTSDNHVDAFSPQTGAVLQTLDTGLTGPASPSFNAGMGAGNGILLVPDGNTLIAFGR